MIRKFDDRLFKISDKEIKDNLRNDICFLTDTKVIFLMVYLIFWRVKFDLFAGRINMLPFKAKPKYFFNHDFFFSKKKIFYSNGVSKVTLKIIDF